MSSDPIVEKLSTADAQLIPVELADAKMDEIFALVDSNDAPLTLDWKEHRPDGPYSYFEIRFPRDGGSPEGTVKIHWRARVKSLTGLLPDLLKFDAGGRSMLHLDTAEENGGKLKLRHWLSLKELRLTPINFSNREEALKYILAAMDMVSPQLGLDYLPSELFANEGPSLIEAKIKYDSLFREDDKGLERIVTRYLKDGGYRQLTHYLGPKFNETLNRYKERSAKDKDEAERRTSTYLLGRDIKISREVGYETFVYQAFFNLPHRGSFTHWKEMNLRDKLVEILHTEWREMLLTHINKVAKLELDERSLQASYGQLLENHDPLLTRLILLYAMSDKTDYGFKRLIKLVQ